MGRQTVFIIVLVLCYFSSHSGDPVQLSGIQHAYITADSLFNLSEPTDGTDSASRAGFDEVIAAFSNEHAFPDSFLFNSLWKRGVLEEILGNFEQAKRLYLQSLIVAGKKNTFSDSVQFKPLLYAGGIYYRQNKFDSTRTFLERAQALTERFLYREELERLYNTLGALNFEGGNYFQSKNCFEKALQIIENDKNNIIRKINFENNIATSLNRLGRYEEALNSYLKLLKYEKNTKDVSLNIGNIYIALNNYPEALRYFHNSKTSSRIEVLNYIANAHLLLNQYDSADYYLHLFETKMQESNKPISKIIVGAHHIYKGDYYFKTENDSSAALQFQKAIIQLMYDFTDSSIYSNPSEFSGTISSFNLFNALVKKAGCFEKLYQKDKDINDLKAAMDAYLSAITLSDYLERTMDSDEAKIFLKHNSNMAYNKAIDMVMLLYHLTQNKALLWKAYAIVERNKSSVLVSNLKAFEIKSKMQVPEYLLQQERDTKYSIARLQIKMDQVSENEAGTELANEKRNDELSLSVIQKKIRQYTGDEEIKEQNRFSGHESFFKDNLKKDEAILDFYFSDSLLYVFAITDSDIKPNIIPVSSLDVERVERLESGLQNIENINEQVTDSIIQEMFTKLISPIFQFIKEKKEWTILPDGIFYYFPFEIIANPSTKRMLIEDYAVSYNFSTQFIAQKGIERNQGKPKLIAMAPFISQGMYSYTDSILLDRLPATNMEISGLKGNILRDATATKSKFVDGANHYDILHLATHAVMDVGNPSQSFIAFYPQDSTQPDSYKLYLNELYSLNLDSTRLMLLSACETGVGKLVDGEGVMSLSRGVLYAGCPSVVTTLWPANDQSTAYIINHFYKYMDAGYDLTNALRLSKLDFIKNYPRQKNPSYWAHLILVGQKKSLYASSPLPYGFVSVAFIIIAGGVAVIRRKINGKHKAKVK